MQEFLDAAAAAGVEIETVSFGALASDVVKVFAHAATAGLLARRRRADRDDRRASPTSRSPPAPVTYAGTNGVPEKDVVILTVEDGEPTFTEAFQPSFVPERTSAS